MKKIITLTLLIIIVSMPQVVFASWWNPFSWNIFHRSETKTEILENRVKELEKRLEVANTTQEEVLKNVTTESSKKTIPPVVKTNTGQIKPISIDPIIKIELCKTKAKESADNIAKNAYMEAAFKMVDQGNEEAALMYFGFADKPEHPADYDSNYNVIYTNCLSN